MGSSRRRKACKSNQYRNPRTGRCRKRSANMRRTPSRSRSRSRGRSRSRDRSRQYGLSKSYDKRNRRFGKAYTAKRAREVMAREIYYFKKPRQHIKVRLMETRYRMRNEKKWKALVVGALQDASLRHVVTKNPNGKKSMSRSRSRYRSRSRSRSHGRRRRGRSGRRRRR